MLADRARRFVTDAPTSAAEAATIIIEGVKADRLRILVGRDAHVIDSMVREDPDHAYDEDFFARFAAEAGWYPGALSRATRNRPRFNGRSSTRHPATNQLRLKRWPLAMVCWPVGRCVGAAPFRQLKCVTSSTEQWHEERAALIFPVMVKRADDTPDEDRHRASHTCFDGRLHDRERQRRTNGGWSRWWRNPSQPMQGRQPHPQIQPVLEVVKGHAATSPAYPRTMHYRGEGVFMISGENTSKYRKLFKPQNLDSPVVTLWRATVRRPELVMSSLWFRCPK